MQIFFSLQKKLFFPTVISCLILVIYFLPLCFLGENAYITIHDTLDGDFVYPLLLKFSGQTFNYSGDAVIENVFNGIPRSVIRSGLGVTVTLFRFFPPHVAFTITFIIVHLIAFLGMYLLLKGYFLRRHGDLALCLFSSVLFALIPFYSIYGISFSGQPLLLFCFLNILNNRSKWFDWLCIALFPLYSFAVLTYPYYLLFLMLLFFFHWYRTRKLNLKFLAAAALLGVMYCLVEFQMVKAVLFDRAFSIHRLEFDRVLLGGADLFKSVKKSLLMVFRTQYHSGTMFTEPVIITVLLVFIRKGWHFPVLNRLAVLILCISVFSGFYNCLIWAAGDYLPIIKIFQFDRFYVVLPLIWILLFTFSLKELLSAANPAIWKPVAVLLFVIQMFIILYENDQFTNNAKLLAGIKIEEPTYKEFFAENIFNGIDRYINKPKSSYRVVSVGMHPSIAQFNGFYTLDGYFDLYPLEYKHRFRKIIAPELDKDYELKKYYEGSGNRVYIFSSELGMNFQCAKTDRLKIQQLDIDIQSLRELGGKYILSAVEIKNHYALGLKFEKKFSDNDSWWDVYLYSI